MTSKANRQIIALVPLLLLLVIAFQNCSSCSSSPVNFTDGVVESVKLDAGGGGTGDAQPFDGKPEAGTYYRLIPGYKCGGQDRIAAVLDVTDAGAKHTALDPADCREVTSDVPLADLEAPEYDKNFIGRAEGIFVKLERRPDPSAQELFTETWCRLENPQGRDIDLVISENLVARELMARLRVAELDPSSGEARLISEDRIAIARELKGDKLAYRSAGGFELVVDKSRAGLEKYPSLLRAQALAGDQAMACRSGSRLDAKAPVAPTLSLDFTKGQFAPFLDFSRASVATYFDAAGVLRAAAAGQPRFGHDPVSGEPRGLLVEGPSTNLLPRSSAFNAAPWAQYGTAAVIADQAQAPDGSMSADLFREGTDLDYHIIGQDVPGIQPGAMLTLSLFAKMPPTNARRYLQLTVQNANSSNQMYARFDLQTGALSQPVVLAGTAGNATASIEPVGQGWYRMRISGVFSATETTVNITLNLADAPGGSSSHQGDGISGIYLWGAQLEAGSVPTSYIPTQAAAAARAADDVRLTDMSWFNGAQGSLLSEVARAIYASEATAPAPRPTVFSFLSGTDHYSLYYDPATFFRAVFQSPSATPVDWNVSGAPAPASMATQRLGLVYQPGNSVLSVNGATAAASPTLTLAPNVFSIGGSAATEKWNGFIRNLLYWPAALAPDELK